jgi:hypothetical protein
MANDNDLTSDKAGNQCGNLISDRNHTAFNRLRLTKTGGINGNDRVIGKMGKLAGPTFAAAIKPMQKNQSRAFGVFDL